MGIEDDDYEGAQTYNEKYNMTFNELVEANELLKNEEPETKKEFKELTASQRATVKMLMEDFANSAAHAIKFTKEQADSDGDGKLKETRSIQKNMN